MLRCRSICLNTFLRSVIVGNFLDEELLSRNRASIPPMATPRRFIFIGSLSERKSPLLLLHSFNSLPDKSLLLDIVGDGPLFSTLRSDSEAWS